MRRISKLGISVLCAATFGTAALAHEGHEGKGRGFDARPEVLEKYDANRDGKLDETERQTMKQEVVKKYDANANGTLDDAERQQIHTDRAAEKFKKLDTNGDGVLSLAEFQAGAQKMHGRHGKGFGR